MRNNWFSREGLTAALPPNVEAGRMAGIIRGTLLGAVFWGGILFACRYGSAYQSLMEWDPLRGTGGSKDAALLADHGACAGADGPVRLGDAAVGRGAVRLLLSGRAQHLSHAAPAGWRPHPAPSGVDGAAAAVLSVLCWAAWRLITPAQTLGHGLFGI